MLSVVDSSKPTQGKTTSTDGQDDDLSIDVLVEDFIELLKTVFPNPSAAPTLLVRDHGSWPPMMHILIIHAACGP